MVSAPAIAMPVEPAPLAERLSSPDYWERMRAFREVASVPFAEQPQYVPLLVRGLQEESMEFRLAAVQSLSGFGKNAIPALPAIVQTLDIQNGEARQQLVQDIARLGSLVVPVLVAALDEQDPYVVWGACETLARIGPPAREAIPSLERLTVDGRPEVSNGARAALLILGKE